MTRVQHLRRIASLGGLARIQKHGNPGAATGRRRGGLRSVKVQRQIYGLSVY